MRNVLIMALALMFGQTPAPKSILGTVTTLKIETRELEVKPDNAAPVPVKLLPNTVVQRIPPGETSLKNATTIPVSDVATGDRVMVTLAANATDVLRILVMSATDIAKRDQADQQDWNRRGISGIVASKSADQIIFKVKTPGGEVQQVITTTDKTKFRRYAEDSVKFADAKASKLDEVSVGDQLRARGEKSADGLKVTAEEVVFGTFLTKAGSVVSVDTAARLITLKELGSGRSLVVKLTADSQIKQAPAGPSGPSGAPSSGPPAARGAGAPPNLAQMIDTMPLGKIDDIKPGTSVIVSSTKGAQADQVTAIVIVANADSIIRLATGQGGRGGVITFGVGGSGGLDMLGIP